MSREVVRPKVIEIISLGAAYLAGLAVGYWKNAEGIKGYWRIGRTFKPPKMSRRAAEELYNGWLAAIKLTLA